MVIGGGFTINYTGGMLTPTTPAGGLAVATGNDILIDGAGSTLTQTTLATEMRIGEGTGSASGTGTLSIDNGAAIGLGEAQRSAGRRRATGSWTSRTDF